MSTLLKSGAEASVLVWPDAGAPAQAQASDPVKLALEAEIVRLNTKLSNQEGAHDAAIAKVRAETRIEVQNAFRREEEKALALLEQALERARADVQMSLQSIDSLALALARTALETVFTPADDYCERIERAITHEIAALKRDIVVAIDVSPGDYAREDTLHALSARIGQVEIKTDAALARGACRLRLTHGEVEISLSAHWRNLKALFNDLDSTPCEHAP